MNRKKTNFKKCWILTLLLTLCSCALSPPQGELNHQKYQMEKLPIASEWESRLMSAYRKTRAGFLRVDPSSGWDRQVTSFGAFDCTLTGIRDPNGPIGIEGTKKTTFLMFGKPYTLSEYPKLAEVIKKYFGELGFHTSRELKGFLQMKGPGSSQITLEEVERASLEIDTGCHLKSKANSNAPATAN